MAIASWSGSGIARHRHVAAHHARELAREGKTEPCPAIAARGQGIGLGEILKQFRPLFGGQANAGICSAR